MKIKNWPISEHPLQRLLRHGPGALSDAELLALLLAGDSAGRPALARARGALGHFGAVGDLLTAPLAVVEQLPGWGTCGYARSQAAIELSKRMLLENSRSARALDCPEAVRNYLRLALARRGHEIFAVLFLDAQHRLIACEEMFRGTLTQTSVYPREIVKQALRHNCAAVILAHNHPSGVAEPSRADEALTHALQSALALIDVRVLDHIVVAASQAVSFAERGLL
ncbi:MAG TPA: DNA repair protein RadC [Burkholderiaceae bacterium]|nr:DNA repair protein RadC [Burkholderiaceae bacterium]